MRPKAPEGPKGGLLRRNLVLPLIALLLGAGCAPQEEKAEALRSHYEVSLSGFTVVQEPQGGPAPALRQDVRLNAVLSHDGKTEETLPGLTLDVAQHGARDVGNAGNVGDAGGNGPEKRRWRVWTGAAKVPGGGSAPVEVELHEVDYQPGDHFRVEVRRQVPAAEQREYRELAKD